jgi:hypothetical protein
MGNSVPSRRMASSMLTMRSLSKSGTPAPRGETAISSMRRIGSADGIAAIGRAIGREADHAGYRPPLVG